VSDARSWSDVVNAAEGRVFYDDKPYDDVRVLVMRGGASLCAYVGVPSRHALGGKHYDDLDLAVHGGLTYAGEGHGRWPEGWYWYGWDYAHSGDYATYYDTTGIFAHHQRQDHKWLPSEVIAEAQAVAVVFKALADAARERDTAMTIQAE
jgi:hypothetical protein